MAELAAQIVAILRDAFTVFDLETIKGTHAIETVLDAVHSRMLTLLESPEWVGVLRTAVDTALLARCY
ncbi:PhoU family transcriptional regulator, partial [Rhodococcus sp. PAE-6]|nr:PhoU family transcriptional regulator [Rhodococcus sp. PAE-6]